MQTKLVETGSGSSAEPTTREASYAVYGAGAGDGGLVVGGFVVVFFFRRPCRDSNLNESGSPIKSTRTRSGDQDAIVSGDTTQ